MLTVALEIGFTLLGGFHRWCMWWELRDKLKPYKFDVAVDVQGRLITGLVLLASGAPIRLGLGGTKELNWMFTNYKAKPSTEHVIKRYIEVAKLQRVDFRYLGS